MGVEYYKGRTIPVFESTIAHNGNLYGLALTESGESYYLYEMHQTPMKRRMHLRVEKGTILELEVGPENKVGVHCTMPNGDDEGFMALPL